MAQPRHLSKAPIAEALLDFRVMPAPAFTAEQFDVLKLELRDRFPDVRAHHVFEGSIAVDTKDHTTAAKAETRANGLVFASAGGTEVAQFRVDGFTYNRLPPYESWDSLFPVALELWSRYVALAQPQFVTRLAVRYINRLKLPWDMDDFSDYLTAAPTIPPPLPQKVAGFLSRVTIVAEDRAMAHITQTFEGGSEADGVSVVLDIDAVRDVQQLPPSDPDIQDVLTRLRGLKNQVFFNMVTDRLLSKYE